MTQPSTKPRRPIRVAIAALSVALVALAALIAFLIWGRSAPTVAPSPSPSPSLTASAQPSPTVTETASPTPTIASPPTTTPSSAAPAPAPSPEDSTPEATTAVSTTASTSTTSAAPSPAAGQTMMWEGKATFEHFTVEVLSEDVDQETAEIVEGKAGLLVEVCVTKAVDGTGGARITTEPWTLEDSDDNTQTPQKVGYKPAFPTDAEYAVGECARGFLTFDYVSVDTDYANLVYDNGLGDRAVWQFH